MNTHVERALIDSLENDLRAKQEQVMNLIRERDELRQRLAAAEAELRSTVADLKAARDGKAIAETAAFFLLEVVKHADPVRYEQALKHWPFLEEANGGRDGTA